MKQYTLSDIQLNMRVNKRQLSGIYDTWIILYRPKDSDMEEDGIIGYIGKEPDAESDRLYAPDRIIIPVFNDSMEAEGDIFDEE